MVHNRTASGVHLWDIVHLGHCTGVIDLAWGAAMSEDTDDRRRGAPDPRQAPGARAAVDRGCTCSVLANAAYRSGATGERPFVDPQCPVHTGV